MEASTVTQYPATQQGGYDAANVDANGYPIGNSGGLNSESTTAMATEGSSYADPSTYNANQVSTAEGAANPLYHAAPAEGALASGSVVGHGYTTVEETHAASYGSFGDGINEVAITTSTETIQNGNASSELPAAAEQQLENSFGVSNEEERLWALVTANCLDFNAWTALIQETEKEDNILKIRKVYDSFLAEFPLCYGYWKKYADHESRLDSIDKVEEVYERAVAAVTYSVDIWVHYCQFAISTHGEPESPDRIRRLFERGLAYVGTDYLSSPLWDEYISYEYALREWRNVAMIYTRILENPIQQLDRYLNSLKEFAASRPLGELRTEEESAALYGSVEITEQGVEGEVRPDDAKQTLTSASTGLTEAEELEKYMAVREEIYKKAKEFDSKIIHFETAIRRPYFHVKPLDDSELENWHNYLDFMERGDDFNKLVKLYERCLIACANYPEYWVRYVLCMEGSRSIELASNALARATQVFVKKQPDIHIFAARFKEHIGDVEGARAEYNFLYVEFSPVILEGIVKHANMEYRLGNKDVAFSVYDGAIASEQAKEYSQILPFIFVQYSRFCFLVAGDAEKSREILTEALEKVHLSKHLLEAVIHLESLLPLPKRVNYLDSFVEKFVGPSSDDSNMASTSDREEVSCIFLEFLDLFGDSQSIKKAENRHSMLFLRHRTTLVSRKRRSDDYLGSEKTKVLKTQAGDLSSSQSLMGSYPNAQNQWPASYGQNPAAWPPVPQAQGQQWASGYAPQGGYSAYGNYASYAHPQVPASVPQSTAYGAYPATSTAQAYPPQNYTQPSAAYAPQPAPTTQAYYSGYY